MSNLPADIINQALDAIGSEVTIGNPEEGGREAQVCLRAYGECVRQLLRSAHWDFARKQAPLTLLADATGQTPGVGNIVPYPWTYSYAYPTDCLKVRFIPYSNYSSNTGTPNGNIVPPDAAAPLFPVISPVNNCRLIPAPFVITTDFNNINTSLQNDWWNQQGTSPAGKTVILTNVAIAYCVYTALIMYPNMWDTQFRAAVVAYLASEIALPLSKDKKFGLTARNAQIAIAKDKILHARMTDGNEGWYSTDHVPDFIRIRNAGLNNWGGMNEIGPGNFNMSWDTCSFSDGSSY